MSFPKYIGKRFLLGISQLLVASVAIFGMVRLIPGNPARIILGTSASEESVRELRETLAIDGPFIQQYLDWLADVVVFDWGQSFGSGAEVLGLILETYPRSLMLAFVGLFFTVVISFPVGIVGATKHQTKWDYFAITFSQIGISIPNFLLGIFLSIIFARHLQFLPASGWVPLSEDPVGALLHLLLPGLTLGVGIAAVITRYLRSEMLDTLNKDYIQMAKAFGHPSRRIVLKYTFRNALVPTLTSIGVAFGYMIGGVVVIEEVFGFPGIGRLVLGSILTRDYPVVQMGLLTLIFTFILVNLIVDLLYAFLNPKIRY